MAFVACVNADKFFVMYLILLNLIVHGHKQGTRLNTCLVLKLCVVYHEFTACVNVSICRLCTGMCSSRVLCVVTL